MDIYSIYKATNKINGKSYIGSDTHWPNRKRDHLCRARIGSDQCPAFHKALRKYGPDSFDWIILYQTTDIINLYEMETYFIKDHCSLVPGGYNISLDGQHPTLGRKHSAETIVKMKKTHTGKPAAISGANHHWTGRNIKGDKNPFFGKKHSKESNAKNAAAHAKTYKLKSPSGDIVEIVNLEQFRRDNGWNNSVGLRRVSQGKQKEFKGWTLP